MDRAIKKKKWTLQRIGIGLAALAFVAFSVYSIALAGRQSSLNVNREKITVSKVERGVFDEFIVVTGVVQPLKTYQLDAIEGGYVAQKLLDGGATVKQGDLILKLENQRLTMDFVNRETEIVPPDQRVGKYKTPAETGQVRAAPHPLGIGLPNPASQRRP